MKFVLFLVAVVLTCVSAHKPDPETKNRMDRMCAKITGTSPPSEDQLKKADEECCSLKEFFDPKVVTECKSKQGTYLERAKTGCSPDFNVRRTAYGNLQKCLKEKDAAGHAKMRSARKAKSEDQEMADRKTSLSCREKALGTTA